ncbi:MAG: GHMP kinase, partial [Flavobacteriaceae bacterium]
MHKFYSHGKLLLSAEYAVLNGAKALALPTKLGQSLEVKTIEQPEIRWKSFDHKNKLWFETNLTINNFNPSTNTETALRLAQIFRALFELNPKVFASTGLE